MIASAMTAVSPFEKRRRFVGNRHVVLSGSHFLRAFREA